MKRVTFTYIAPEKNVGAWVLDVENAIERLGGQLVDASVVEMLE
jgi:hypothetical protein